MYKFVKGKRGGDLLHVLDENMLYVKHSYHRNASTVDTVYICYHTILSAETKKTRENEDRTQCTARVRLLSNGVLDRMLHSNHTNHQNHDRLVRDLKKLNDMKSVAKALHTDLCEDAHRMPNRNIFQREISKLVSSQN